MVIINDFDVTIGNRLKMYVFYAMNIKTMQIRAYTTWPQLMWDQVGFQQGEMFVCGLGSYLAELQLHISVHNLCGQTTHCRRGPMIFGKTCFTFPFRALASACLYDSKDAADKGLQIYLHFQGRNHVCSPTEIAVKRLLGSMTSKSIKNGFALFLTLTP